MSPALSIVANNTLAVSGGEGLAAHIRRLQTEARALAVQHIKALEDALDEVARLAAEVASGGDAFPVGAREIARQLADEAAGRRMSLDVVTERTR